MKPSREELYHLLYEDGLTPQQVASRKGVTYTTVRIWMMEYALGARHTAIHLAREHRHCLPA